LFSFLDKGFVKMFFTQRVSITFSAFLLVSTGLVYGQTLPAPATTSQQTSRVVNSTSSQVADDPADAGMDAVAAQTVVERLVVLISDSEADPDKRAKACEFLAKFGQSGAPAVPAIMGFIEHQLTTGKLKHYFHARPSSVVIFPEGTTGRLARAVHALGEVGPMAGEALPLLKKVTVTPVRDTLSSKAGNSDQAKGMSPRALAAEAIGKIGRPESVEILVALSNNDPNADTRSGALKGLATLASSNDSRTSLTASAQLRVIAFTDPHEGIREQASELLENQAKKQLTRVVKASPQKKN